MDSMSYIPFSLRINQSEFDIFDFLQGHIFQFLSIRQYEPCVDTQSVIAYVDMIYLMTDIL